MEYIQENARNVPVLRETEVLVLGSGPAGIGAALASARMGAKTLIIEQSGALGGVSTSGMMSHWTGTVDSRLYREVLKRACEEEGRPFDEDAVLINPEILKRLYLKMLREAGADILLYTVFSDILMCDGVIKGVYAEGKEGRFFVRADIVIDCTGDGDVAYRAGVPYILGRSGDHRMQPMTLMFKVGGVDTDKAVYPYGFECTIDTAKGELQALAKKYLPYPAGHVLLYRSTLPGIVTCNMTNCIEVDGTRSEDLTKAQVVCTEQIPVIVEFLQNYVPGYEKCYLLSSAASVGVRETRHFEGLYTITEEDIYAARQFDDWVVKGAHFNFDIHNLHGAGLDEHGLQKGYKQAKGYTIPYRCLLPCKTDNLLLAGRCISGTHVAHSNYRVMPICFAMGEGAGTAAALAVARGVMPRDIDAADIQKYL